jgi:tRNA modification GTPase
MSRPADTIAALATPTGTAALAVLRISGPDTAALARAVTGRPPVDRRARRADYRDQAGTVVDDVLVTFLAGPRSYTGEDTLEISCHGSPYIARRILDDLLARGCRAAGPGEFTQRAFLNGRMDLSQAEAVMDLIHAHSERALAAANQQLRGALGRRLNALVGELLAALARIEAYIDFPDEDLPAEDRADVLRRISHIFLNTKSLIATSRYGSLLRDGIRTVIIGAPNAGKSSLLNRLVGAERALVSPEPGTTRDFIEEWINVGPHALRLIDTAGLNPSPTPLERLGMQKTAERAAEADLFLLVLDATAESSPALPDELLARVRQGPTLVLINKSDLAPHASPALQVPGAPVLAVSALTGQGFADLQAAIVAAADQFRQDAPDLVAISARHAQALQQARDCLTDAETKLRQAGPIELVASDLRGVMAAFGEITGRIDNEQMLDALFATFCIGK